MIRNINSPNSGSEEENYEDNIMKEAISQISYNNLIKDQNGYIKKIITLNEKSVELILKQNTKSGLSKLQTVEKMLEFAANCGVKLDRNLIIVGLYNQACTYQRLWLLDKAQHYLDGAIYNTELIVQEEEAEFKISKDNDIHKALSVLVQRQSFLTRAYLQLCAILSQLGEHKKALETAKKSLRLLSKLFKMCNEYCQEEGYSSSPQPAVAQQNSQNMSVINTTTTSSEQQRHSAYECSSDSQPNVFSKRNEVPFQKVVFELARPILQDMVESSLEDLERDEILQLHKAKEQIYFWRSNPENNERLIRKELQAPPVTGQDSNSSRSLLGVQGGLNWAENFNIGTIMHIQPLLYNDFCVFGEMILELQKKLLLEKVIFMSIAYFTMATEMRFLHLEKLEQFRFQPLEQDKLSEIYHLKAIEIACKHITCSTPFINHLITSYQKHYKQNLDTIPEESISHKSQSEFNLQSMCKDNEFFPIQFSPNASTQNKYTPQKVFNQNLKGINNNSSSQVNVKKDKPKNDQSLSKNQLLLQQIMSKGVKLQQGQLCVQNIAQFIKQKGLQQQNQNQSIIEQNKSAYSKSQYISVQSTTPRGNDSSRVLLPQYSLNESRGSVSKRSFDIDQKLAQMTAKNLMVDSNQRCFPNKIQPRAQDMNFICELSNKKSKQPKQQSSPKTDNKIDHNKIEKQLQLAFAGTKKLSNLLHLNISEINLQRPFSNQRPQSSDRQNKINFSLQQMQKLKPRNKEGKQQPPMNFSSTDRSHYEKKQVKDTIIEKAKYSQLIQQFDTYLRNLKQK